jgi:chromosomal replication initiation ATPase DnaA
MARVKIEGSGVFSVVLFLTNIRGEKTTDRPYLFSKEIALYLVKRCCDRTLPEMAEYFGISDYSTVSWNYRAIESQMVKDKKPKDRIEKIVASIS